MLSNIIVIRSYVLIAILHDLSERSKFSLVNSDLECTIFTDVVMISFHLNTRLLYRRCLCVDLSYPTYIKFSFFVILSFAFRNARSCLLTKN